MSQDKTPHGQNVTGKNDIWIKCHRIMIYDIWIKCHRTKRHTDKMPHGQNIKEKNATWAKCHMGKMSQDAPVR